MKGIDMSFLKSVAVAGLAASCMQSAFAAPPEADPLDSYKPLPPSGPPQSVENALRNAKLFIKRNAKGEYVNPKVSVNAAGKYELSERIISTEEYAALMKKKAIIASDVDEIILKKDKPNGVPGEDESKATTLSPSFYIVHYHNPAEGPNWESNTFGDVLDTTITKPIGATTQWLTFRMNAQNYFSQNDHLAFITRFSTSPGAVLYGLGSIFGHNENYGPTWYGDPPYYDKLAKGCSSYSSQNEFFLGNANVVTWQSCVSGGMSDNTWYYFQILASDNSAVAVSIHQWSSATNSWIQKTRIGEPPFSASATSAYFNNVPSATAWTPTTAGIAIFNAFSSKPAINPNGPPGKIYSDPWYIVFDQVARGWY
jgi:hypothetical protein